MQRGRVQGLLFPCLYFLFFILQLVTLFSHGGGLSRACSRPQVQWSPEDSGRREQWHSGRGAEGAAQGPEKPELCVADTWVNQCFFFLFFWLPFLLVIHWIYRKGAKGVQRIAINLWARFSGSLHSAWKTYSVISLSPLPSLCIYNIYHPGTCVSTICVNVCYLWICVSVSCHFCFSIASS